MQESQIITPGLVVPEGTPLPPIFELEFEGDTLDPDLLPDPVGYRLLVAPVVIRDLTNGGIAIPENVKESLNYFRSFGKVLKMGDDAYNHDKFHGKPWCKVGDIIQYQCYDGQVVHVCPGDMVYTFRILNDDSVFTTVKNPKTLNFI
jgi:co-chaperonin GroES (HSP10)